MRNKETTGYNCIPKIIVIFLILFSNDVLSQVLEQNIFSDQFLNNRNGWSITDLRKYPYETYISQSQEYICHLPIRNSENWNWTWVSLPTQVLNKVDQEESLELQFDWRILETNKGNFRFGLMFDTHNVDGRSCPGGDFRIIWVYSTSNGVKVDFRQTKDCNSQTEWRIDGKNVSLRSRNKFKLVKNKYTYKIQINDEDVLDFDYKGKLKIDHLNFDRGKYAFDNFSITKKSFSATESTHGTENDGITKIWVLLAGIERYSRNQLNYTVDDTKAMYSFWTSNTGGKVPKEQIKLLTDFEATSSNILLSAESLFSKADGDDVIITFLSGHGGPGTFAAIDQSIQYDYLNQIISKSKAKKKLCIVDACHSGTFGAKKKVLIPQGEELSEEKMLELFYTALAESGNGISYLLACRPNQLSTEDPKLNHGVFTYFLLEALKGAADQDQDRLVTIQEVYTYLNKEIPSYQFDQNPVIRGTFDPNIPLSITN